MDYSARTPHPRPPAFTLLELLAVIALLAILSGLVLGVGRRAVESGRIARARAELAAIGAALETYSRTYGDYPRTDDAAQLLRALLGRRGPASNAAINGRALLEPAKFTITNDRLVDPWGQPYRYNYKRPGDAWTNPAFVLYSCGPDQSDFSRLTKGGFVDATAAANADNIHANRN
jgi:general secretion pathway protein G